ncbi:hypothetical protein ACIPM5_35785 [Streptomyces microflavus]|uniref:hypothetical protein n=1 Tax=Streptomyces microflavus TaxID=1919 RepID=UPI003800644A
MLRIWMRHESRQTERRAALVPEDARKLIAEGVHLTVEESSQRAFRPCVPDRGLRAVLFASGPDADALFAAMPPVLRDLRDVARSG